MEWQGLWEEAGLRTSKSDLYREKMSLVMELHAVDASDAVIAIGFARRAAVIDAIPLGSVLLCRISGVNPALFAKDSAFRIFIPPWEDRIGSFSEALQT